jgi:hypothetical protein
VDVDRDVGVDGADGVAERVDLRATDVGDAVAELTVQVRELDTVVVDDADRADSGRREERRDGTAEPARADHEHARRPRRRWAASPKPGRAS